MGRIIALENFSFTYRGQKKSCLNEISLSIEEGEFCLLIGPTGCGKSTLLRQFKREIAPTGTMDGNIVIEEGADIGYVFQDPESSIVSDRVYHEIAFGPENMGLSKEDIMLRVAESVGIFGLGEHLRDEVKTLSGGQKQMLALCSVLATRPNVLILDEPCSMLDPVAARNFVDLIVRLNRDMGMTILLCEHRLEDTLCACDRVFYMEDGATVCEGAPQSVCRELFDSGSPMAASLPASARLWKEISADSGDIPLTVREARALWKRRGQSAGMTQSDIMHIKTSPDGKKNPTDSKREAALEVKEAYYRYERDGADVLRGFGIRLFPGETYCIMGENASGKSTACDIMAALKRPYRGKVKLFGKDISGRKGSDIYRDAIAYLPQSPEDLFGADTGIEELLEAGTREEAFGLAGALGIEDILDKNPCDLSCGQMQALAIAKVLLLRPKVLIMDEPAKGMDAAVKDRLSALFTALKNEGVAICMVSHDLEFCALTADRCDLLFDGRIIGEGAAREFFDGNYYYTPQIMKITGGMTVDG